MPLKAFCDNCKREVLFSEPQPYGIVFLMPNPANRFVPKQIEKMLCQQCFIEFYTKAGYKWSNIQITNGKDKH